MQVIIEARILACQVTECNVITNEEASVQPSGIGLRL